MAEPGDAAAAAAGWRTDAYRRLNKRVSSVLGEKSGKALAKLDIHTLGDLVRHAPRRYLHVNQFSELDKLEPGEDAIVSARVVRSDVKGYGKKSRLEVTISDDTTEVRSTFFGRDYNVRHWERQLTPGARAIFAGRVSEYQGQRQLTHPDFAVIDEHGFQRMAGSRELANKGGKGLARVAQRDGLIGIYPSTGSLGPFELAEFLTLALHELGDMADPLPRHIVDECGLAELYPAIERVHLPESAGQAAEGLRRLRFDEALSFQLAMAYRRARAQQEPSTARPRRTDGLLAAFDAQLPFDLTAGQDRVSDEIFADIARDQPMQRLLQGEVGSGKTLVALRAMLAVVDAGGQAALLAPTEVLARQHHRTITGLLGRLADGGQLGAEAYATRVELLVGSMSAVQKRNAGLRAASGDAGIVVGTHALLGESVQFADLGLVVVDEQHRFGVEQRSALGAKAAVRPHVLVMTATPIPRTVAMTVFGDLEISTLTEIPAGRSVVQTVVVDENAHPGWVDRAWQRIREEVAAGRQAFVVCPRISKTDRSAESAGVDADCRTVEETYAELVAGPLAGLRVEMLHGQLATEEKDDVMRRFAVGEVDVLVATTVIEVGVDVPNASVMVIADADRFGISQLHQLRGRIGRGAHPGVCLLLSRADADGLAAERLRAVAASTDGFELADADLAQRREGDVLGASQAGARSSLRLVRVIDHADEVALARDVARRIVAEDPECRDDGIADMVSTVERLADAEWLDRA